ncbi:hypothetical protein ACFLSH_02060 [Bacteroidota bacterium]
MSKATRGKRNEKNTNYIKIAALSYVLEILLFLILLANSSIPDYSAYKLDGSIEDIFIVALLFSFIISTVLAILIIFKKSLSKVVSASILNVNLFLILMIVIVLIIGATNPPPTISNGYVVNYGIYEIPTNEDSTKDLYDQRKLLLSTNDVPAKLGTRFGFDYVIKGEPSCEFVNIKKNYKIPFTRNYF